MRMIFNAIAEYIGAWLRHISSIPQRPTRFFLSEEYYYASRVVGLLAIVVALVLFVLIATFF
jgi:hypothetical protein